MAGKVPSWELMFRSVWQSCRAQSRDCRGGTRKEERERRAVRGRERNKKTRGRRVEKGGEGVRKRPAEEGEKSGGSGAKGGEGREEMARWSLSVGKRD